MIFGFRSISKSPSNNYKLSGMVSQSMTDNHYTRGRKDYITVSPHRGVLVPTLNWVMENQPMVSIILTQLSSRKQFGSRRKMSLKKRGR